MGIERMLRGIAGFFVLLSLALAYFHHWCWLFFTGFVGLNLLQSSFTNWCPMIAILQAMGYERASTPACAAAPKSPADKTQPVAQ